MTPTETTTILRQFNEWRRGDEDIPQPDPREIGEAIDAAIAMIERVEVAEKERGIDEQRIADLMEELNRVGHVNDALRATQQLALEVLENVRGNINPERGYAEELEADVERAIATITLQSAKGEDK